MWLQPEYSMDGNSILEITVKTVKPDQMILEFRAEHSVRSMSFESLEFLKSSDENDRDGNNGIYEVNTYSLAIILTDNYNQIKWKHSKQQIYRYTFRFGE
jgi:methyltransferase-like protein